jgi:hypothetical protein
MQKIPLYGRVAAGRVAVVDDEDYELVMRYRWHVIESERSGAYAVARTGRGPRRGKYVYMHNLIMGAIGVDHISHNGLDNRRSNLRLATGSENNGNRRMRRRGSSQYKGVCRDRGRWTVAIVRDGKVRQLGRFLSEADAARAYDAAAREVYGPFACLNFPGPGEISALAYEEPDLTAAEPGTSRPPLGTGESLYLGVRRVLGKWWQASIEVKGKRRHLGNYASEIEAALAYDAAAGDLHGQAARFNFPDGLSPELSGQMLAQREAGKVEVAARHEAGREARRQRWSEREPVKRTCEICGGEYETRSVHPTKTCRSNPCVNALRSKRRSERKAQ